MIPDHEVAALNQAVLDVLISRGYEQNHRIKVGARALQRLLDAYLAANPTARTARVRSDS